jgi:GNAT superfamily N-acetyltransferase
MRVMTQGSEGAVAEEVAPGVVCARTPEMADRSLFNGVVYRDGAALLDALDAVSAFYAGAPAWMVWVRPGDDAVAAALRDAGLRSDASPPMMGAALDDVRLDDATEDAWLGIAEPTDWSTLATVNDQAWHAPAGTFARPLSRLPVDAALRAWVAGDAQPASVVATLREGEDCYLLLVATRPEAQGLGLASALIRDVLRWARADGATSTTLEATEAGFPVYEQLGYRALGTLQMWEWRGR